MDNKHPFVAFAALAAALAGAPPANAEAEDPVMAQVRAADDALTEAHSRGDIARYLQGLSDRFLYIDIGGKRVTKELLVERRAADKRRQLSSESSENEGIRISDNAVLLRGRDKSLATYYGGLPRHGDSRWTALWVREADGAWRLTAETATPVRDDGAQPYAEISLPPGATSAFAGDWLLDLQPPITLSLKPDGNRLIASLSSDPVRFTFAPHAPSQFHALERDFQIVFAPDGKSLTLATWGTPTRATRR